MKALGLIIMCVVLLASLQASYLIVEAKKPRKTHIHVEDHTNDESDVSSAGHVTDDVKPRHNKHHNHEHKHGDNNDEHVKEQMVHTFGSRIDGGWKERKHPNRISDDLIIPAPNAVEDKPDIEDGDMDPNGIMAEDIPIPKVDQPTTEHNVTEMVESAATIIKEPDTLPLYDQMMGDAPGPDHDHGHQDAHSKKYKHGGTGDKKDRKTHKGGPRKENHARKTCEDDSDCGEGGCCLQRKKGEKVCKHGGVKDIGRKCASSCVCKTGLQCYVPNVNKRGRKRKSHHGKAEMGRCADPDAEQNPGYFMTAPPMETEAPVTSLPVQA